MSALISIHSWQLQRLLNWMPFTVTEVVCRILERFKSPCSSEETQRSQVTAPCLRLSGNLGRGQLMVVEWVPTDNCSNINSLNAIWQEIKDTFHSSSAKFHIWVFNTDDSKKLPAGTYRLKNWKNEMDTLFCLIYSLKHSFLSLQPHPLRES